MEEIGGFFEEMNNDDCEEVELSAKEDDFESIEEFKESAVSDEIEGVLRESGVEEEIIETDHENSEPEQTSGNNNIKVIYVQRNSIQNNSESVSDNQVVVLDSQEFDVLVNEIRNLKQDPVGVQTVSQNDVTPWLDEMKETLQMNLIVQIVLFGLIFGFFVKESIFRTK